MTASYSLLKTYARMFGEAREGSYIYIVNNDKNKQHEQSKHYSKKRNQNGW